ARCTPPPAGPTAETPPTDPAGPGQRVTRPFTLPPVGSCVPLSAYVMISLADHLHRGGLDGNQHGHDRITLALSGQVNGRRRTAGGRTHGVRSPGRSSLCRDRWHRWQGCECEESR